VRLYRCLDLSRQLSSTNSHDQLFAFLGLLETELGDYLLLTPDYDKNIADVYVDTTLFFIQREFCLDIFELIYDQPHTGNRIPGLPSWANDWTQKSVLELFHSNLFCTGGPNYFGWSPLHASRVGVSSDRRRLKLQVYFAGKIRGHGLSWDEYTGDSASSMSDSGEYQWDDRLKAHLDPVDLAEAELPQNPPANVLEEARYRRILGLALRLEFREEPISVIDPTHWSPPSKTAPYPTGESMYEAFWWTLICNLDFSGNKVSDDMEKAFEAYHRSQFHFHWVHEGENYMEHDGSPAHKHVDELMQRHDVDLNENFPQELIHEFLRRHEQHTTRRRFCISDTKLMGWVPRRASKGDLICVIPGARMPYVLRSAGEEWEIVGHAYIHGLMGDVVGFQDIELTKTGRKMLGEFASPVDIVLK
jgi:hypothetical protein